MNKHNYQLTFEDRGIYLYAYLTGEDSFAASLSYWNEIADKVAELNSRKLLIHEDLTGVVAESEVSEVILDLAPSGLMDIQIAFFDENHSDAELNEFGQSIAISKGVNVRIFSTLADATTWIMQDD